MVVLCCGAYRNPSTSMKRFMFHSCSIESCSFQRVTWRLKFIWNTFSWPFTSLENVELSLIFLFLWTEIPGFPGCCRQINTDWVNQGELKKRAIHHALCEESVYGQSTTSFSLWRDFDMVCGGVSLLYECNTWIRFCMNDQCISKNRSQFDLALDLCSNQHKTERNSEIQNSKSSA